MGNRVVSAAPDTGRSILSAQEAASTPTLVRAAQRGDGAAFMTLLDHNDRTLRALAFRVLGDRSEMDDALQEVALKAFAALPGFRGEAAFGTWLHRIAYTTCLNRLRGLDGIAGRRGRPRRPRPRRGDAVVTQVELTTALASLTAEQRAVVALVLEEGFDHRSAARALDVPEGTVASRLAAARTVLRGLLDEPSVRGSDS